MSFFYFSNIISLKFTAFYFYFSVKVILDLLMQKTDNKLQLERILFFSDAVIAIAMTLLIIEIKAPHIIGLPNEQFNETINELVSKFVSFIISFFVIAIYWKAHHHLFGFAKNYTDTLIWINILFLLTIVIMPFSSAFYSENFGSNIAYSVYCINIIFTGLLNCWLVKYISSGHQVLATVSGNRAWIKYYTLRSLVAPMVFFVSMLLSFYSTFLSRLCFLAIFPLIFFLNRKYHAAVADSFHQ